MPSRLRAEGITRTLATIATGTAAAVALSFALSIVVARLLGPLELASYATVLASVLVTGQLVDVGLGNACAYFGRHRPGALHVLLRIVIRHVVVCLAILGVAMTAILFVGPESLRAMVSPPWFAAVIVVFIGATTAVNVFPVLVLARANYATYAGFSTLTAVMQLAFVLVAFALTGGSWKAFISALALAQVAIAVSEASYLYTLATAERETVTGRECYLYGIRIKWAEVMKLISNRIDILVVALILPAREVGLYAVALSFRELGMTPFRTYSAVFQNLLVDRHRERTADRDLIIGSLVILTILSGGLALGAAVIFPFALPLIYGREYAGAALPAILLFASTIFLSTAGLCWMVFNMEGRPALTSAIVTVLGVAGPTLVWVLAYRGGLIGAATAGLMSGLLVCAISVAALVKLRGYTIDDVAEVARRTPTFFKELRAGAVTTVRRLSSSSLARRG